MLIVGISGTTLSAQESEWLRHPALGGVILFTRNFASRDQTYDLCAALRSAADKPLLLCVDQEGGRVQRFRPGYSQLPPLETFGTQYAQDPQRAKAFATEHAWLMANEVLSSGLDLSYAPVVDLARGNLAIGNRAFHADPQIVAEFTEAYLAGLREAGMAATLKHFPGHGSVLADTHFDEAIDERDLATLERDDLLPFVRGIELGAEAVMMAHVKYPAIAPEPAGYAPFWIRYLRERLRFQGVIFSDDIGMAAAEEAGGIAARLKVHYDAGCDSVLVCAPALVEESLAAMEGISVRQDALHPLFARRRWDWPQLLGQQRYHDAQRDLNAPTMESTA